VYERIVETTHDFVRVRIRVLDISEKILDRFGCSIRERQIEQFDKDLFGGLTADGEVHPYDGGMRQA